MDEFNSDDHYIYYRGQESLRRNGVAIMVSKRVRNAVLGCNLKNDRMISVHFQGKPFNMTVIQVYAPTTNAEEAKVEWFYEDLEDLLELTAKKDVLFIIGDWNAKVGSQEISGVTGKFDLGVQNEACILYKANQTLYVYLWLIHTVMLLEDGVCCDQWVLLAKFYLPLPCFILYSKAKFACYSRCFLTSYFCIPVPYNEKDIFFGC